MSRSIFSPSAGRIVSRFAIMALLLLSVVALPFTADARAPIAPVGNGEVPTTGGLRPGPVGLTPPLPSGVKPIGIRIERAKVDSQVEVQDILNGVMQNPSGPFIVSWYQGTGKLGQADNIVMAGHLDYWDVGQAVFYNLGKLKKDDVIEVTGDNNQTYRYKVEWVKNFKVAELDEKGVQEIVGSTPDEQLTLITCGGPFDYARGEYLERMVVRAARVD